MANFVVQPTSFPSQLAQLVAQGRPQFQGAGRPGAPMPHLVNYDQGGEGIGQALGAGIKERMDFLYNPDKVRERASTASQILSQMQDKELRSKVIRRPEVQKQLRDYAEVLPEAFFQNEEGLWDAADSTFLKQKYRKGEADIEQTGASTEHIQTETGKTRTMTPLQAKAQQLDNELAGKTVEDQVQLLREKVLGLKAETKLRGAQTSNVQQDTARSRAMLPGDLEHQAVQNSLGRTQEQKIIQDMSIDSQMAPYERNYKEAATRHLLASSEAELMKTLADTEKLKMKARNASVKELLDSRAEEEKRQAERVKLYPGAVDPYTAAKEHMEATQGMISGFGPTSITTGLDEKGNPIIANVPGAIEDPAGRYWVWRSFAKSFQSFGALWERGDEQSLNQARELMNRTYRMYQQTYGQIKDPKVLELVNPMPEVNGFGGEAPAANEIFKSLVQMILTVDSLEPAMINGKANPNKLQANDQVHRIAEQLGVQALPPSPKSWYKPGKFKQPVQEEKK